MTLQEALKAYNRRSEVTKGLMAKTYPTGVFLHLQVAQSENGCRSFDTEAEAIKWLQDNTPKDPAEELLGEIENAGLIIYGSKGVIRKWFKENKGRTI